MAFKIIQPLAITGDRIVANTFSSGPEPIWFAGGNFDDGEVVRYQVIENGVVQTEHLYKSAIANNTGIEPGTTAADGKWVRYGTDNKYAMFDDFINTRSDASTAGVTIKLDNDTDVVQLLNVNFGYVEVNLKDPITDQWIYPPNAIIYQINWPIGSSEDDYDAKRAIRFSIPTHSNGYELSLNFFGNVSSGIGSLVLGRLISVAADIELGASVTLKDYSVKKTDDFGNIELLRRDYATLVNFRMQFDKSLFNYMFRMFAAVRGRLIVFIPFGDDEDYEVGVVYGICEEFQQIIQYKTLSVADVRLLSLT